MEIKVENLTRRFGGTLALDDVSFTLASGKVTGLVGPNGAGKTTLMRLICGLMTKTAGELSVVGLDVTEHPQAVQDLLSYMPQKFGLYEDLTVQENLDLYADLHGVPQKLRAKRFAHLLAMTELAPFTGRLAGKLSGGMKQRVVIAMALACSPELILADEPTVQLHDKVQLGHEGRITAQTVQDIVLQASRTVDVPESLPDESLHLAVFVSLLQTNYIVIFAHCLYS